MTDDITLAVGVTQTVGVIPVLLQNSDTMPVLGSFSIGDIQQVQIDGAMICPVVSVYIVSSIFFGNDVFALVELLAAVVGVGKPAMSLRAHHDPNATVRDVIVTTDFIWFPTPNIK